MKSKKVLSIVCTLLAAIFAFSFTACGGDGEGDEEYTLELEDGKKQLTIYYTREAGYADCDVWLWGDGLDGAFYYFHECEYGAKIVANVPEELTSVGYIIRTNCTPGGGWDGVVKDGTDADRKATLSGTYTTIYTKAGDPNNYMSEDGGKTLEIMRYISVADMQDKTHVKVSVSDNSALKLSDVKITDADDNEVAISSIGTGNMLTLSSALDLSKAYTLSVEGFDSVGIVPMSYFSSKDFENEYTYEGDDLGVTLAGGATTFRLWAPTASEVRVNLFEEGSWGKAYESRKLTRGAKGVWSLTVDEDLNGVYYTYSVTTSMGTQEAVDPYARSAGTNGLRGMILDLDSTDPSGWTNTPFVPFGAVEGKANYTDAEIWEVHVRDFSNAIESSQYKGKYLAFTESLKNSAGVPVGVDYLKELGITHVHLLPSYDYASVDESKTGKDAEFNWGYDPQNYNVPEGSYSTDPSDGSVRVNEYKQMVQALHDKGIGVIMDVVYNHTYSSDSNLNKVVPYYYYRYTAEGVNSNGSGCGNETASERSMVRRYMVDSVKYWLTEYNLDGFRFDLMGVHDITTIQAIEKAVHEINPNALIYGEGWTGGATGLADSDSAILNNLSKLNNKTGVNGDGVNGVAMFNDVIRDGVKGSVWDINDTGFATGAKTGYLNKVLFGVTGSYANVKFTDYGSSWYADNPTQVVNYVSAHDNNTLWDRILSVYGKNDGLNFKRNALSAAIVQTSLGIPFMQAGEEMLRSKVNADGTYNENSYNAPDSVNNINWEALKPDSDEYKMMQYYKGLIEFRQANETLRLTYAANTKQRKYVCNPVETNQSGAFTAFTVTNLTSGEKLLIVYNAKTTDVDFTLPAGNWDLYVNGTQAGATAISANQSGAQKIEKVSCYVYKAV